MSIFSLFFVDNNENDNTNNKWINKQVKQKYYKDTIDAGPESRHLAGILDFPDKNAPQPPSSVLGLKVSVSVCWVFPFAIDWNETFFVFDCLVCIILVIFCVFVEVFNIEFNDLVNNFLEIFTLEHQFYIIDLFDIFPNCLSNIGPPQKLNEYYEKLNLPYTFPHIKD